MSIVTESAAVRSNHHADDEQRVCREVSDPEFNCEGCRYGLDAGCDVMLRATNGGLRWLKYHRLMRQNYVMPHTGDVGIGQRGKLSNSNIQLPLLESPTCHHRASPTFHPIISKRGIAFFGRHHIIVPQRVHQKYLLYQS